MKRFKMKMLDPVIPSGESRTAIATFPVKPAGLACSAELWLSRDQVTKDATSGLVPFTATGADQSVSCPISMPEGGYAYYVLLDIVADGVVIYSFLADEQVLVPWVGPPEITW